MTDNRDGTPGSDGIGGSGAAPPPFPEAAPPVPVAPPAPAAPPAPYPAASARGAPWGWIVAAILAAALIILVCLYFFTSLLDKEPRDSWESGGSSFSQSGSSSGSGSGSGSGSSILGSSGSTGSGQGAYQAPPPSPPPTTTNPVAGYAPTVGWLTGTWGPACPGSAAQAITLFGDGRLSAQGGEGSWTLDGYTVTLSGNGRTLVTRWEYLSQDMARVTQVANGRVETVRRCM
jgi:hypothetical protein